MKHDAESNFKKAIELKSWSADPVYALGVLYRGQGRMKLAERCFQRVREISDEHTGASRALVDLRRQHPGRKAKLLFLKKRFFKPAAPRRSGPSPCKNKRPSVTLKKETAPPRTVPQDQVDERHGQRPVLERGQVGQVVGGISDQAENGPLP